MKQKMLKGLFAKHIVNHKDVCVKMIREKILAFMHAQRRAHATEVADLHKVIDKLTDELVREKILHNGTQKLLTTTQESFDQRHAEVSVLLKKQQQLQHAFATNKKSFSAECTESTNHIRALKEKNGPLFRALGQIHAARCSELGPKPKITDYKKFVQMTDVILQEILPNQTKKA